MPNGHVVRVYANWTRVKMELDCAGNTAQRMIACTKVSE